jgi:hypothetical protein
MTNRQAYAVLAAMIIPSALSIGCATNCVRGPEGTTCTAKSLKRFDGTPPPPQVVDYVPGSPIVIAVQYGSVLVSRSTSSKVEVEFRPFCYAGYDDQAGAYQQLGQNLETRVDTSAGVAVHVARHGGTNGLGANVNVRLPDSFNGSLAITNAGDGPLNEFDVRVEYVAQATALDIRNRSSLGNCWAAGTPAIQSSGVSCGGYISVFDVSDKLEIINTGGYHRGDDTPAITLRLAKVSPTSPGGTITTASGSIAATFPRAGGFSVAATSPNGTVQVGPLPPICQVQTASPASKTVACGAGPIYHAIAGNSSKRGPNGKASDVVLDFQ